MADEQHSSQQEQIQALQTEVASLQLKLHQLHATDANTWRRSYATLAQHVEALKTEVARLEKLIQELEPELYPPEFFAEEMGKAAVVSGTVYGIFTIVATITPLPASSWLRRGLVAVTALVITWRFAASSIGRFATSLLDHQRRRKACLKGLAELQQRIDILHALTSGMPSAIAATAPGQQAGQQSGQAASTAEGVTWPAVQPEQYELVDLPRVESGGFILPSLVSSPAPDLRAQQLSAAAAVGSLQSSPTGLSPQQHLSAAHRAASAGAASLPEAARHGSGTIGTSQSARMAAGQRLTAATQQLLEQQLLQQQQQSGQGPLQEKPAPDVCGESTSAYAVPTNLLTSGWGGVLVQQQRAFHQWQQQQRLQERSQQQQQSSDSDAEEGEWVHQPVPSPKPRDASTAGTTAGRSNMAQQQQQPPAGQQAAPSRQATSSAEAGSAAAGSGKDRQPGNAAAITNQETLQHEEHDISPASSQSSEGVLLERD